MCWYLGRVGVWVRECIASLWCYRWGPWGSERSNDLPKWGKGPPTIFTMYYILAIWTVSVKWDVPWFLFSRTVILVRLLLLAYQLCQAQHLALYIHSSQHPAGERNCYLYFTDEETEGVEGENAKSRSEFDVRGRSLHCLPKGERKKGSKTRRGKPACMSLNHHVRAWGSWVATSSLDFGQVFKPLWTSISPQIKQW